MGTGIVSILLHNLPYNGRWLYWISVVIFCFNILLFVVFLLISLARYSLFKGIWNAMIRHPVQSLFLGEYLFLRSLFSVTLSNTTIARYFSDGFCNDYQHDMSCLCSSLGPMGSYHGLGILVD